MQNRGRLTHFDALRALAMLCIVAFHHIDDYAGDVFYNWSRHCAWPAMGLFLFIAGYLAAYGRTIDTFQDFTGYLKHRWIKLYPPYLVALILQRLLGITPEEQVIPGILMLTPLLDIHILTLWFVPAIMYCYALGAVTLWFRTSLQREAAAAIIFAVLLLVDNFTPWLDTSLIIMFPVFFLGIESCLRKRLMAKLERPPVIALMVAMALTFSCLTGMIPADVQANIVTRLLSAAKTLFWAAAIVPMGRHAVGCHTWPGVKSFSSATYFVYLYHRSTFHLAVYFYYTFWEYRPASVLLFLYICALLPLCPLCLWAQRLYSRLLRKLSSFHLTGRHATIQ